MLLLQQLIRRFSSRRALVLSLLSVVLTVFSLGCGGGTSGTGVKEFSGIVKGADGAPVSGAEVTIVETGASTTTDEGGNFSVATEVGEGEVSVQVTAVEVSGEVEVANLPQGNALVEIALEVDDSAQTVTATAISITSEEEQDTDGAESEEEPSNDGVVIPPPLVDELTPGTITGQLVSPSGEPLAGVTVKIPGSELTAVTDEFGNFVISGVSPGESELELMVAGENFESPVVVITDSDSETEVILELDQSTNVVTVESPLPTDPTMPEETAPDLPDSMVGEPTDAENVPQNFIDAL